MATTLEKNVRTTDTVTRIGGDEFVVLMPETDSQHAEPAIYKLRALLDHAMKKRGWPVTFSIGVLSFQIPFASVDAMLNHVDRLMYEVKNRHKDDVTFAELS